jgi:uncharacterized protein YfaS (alpha-2-macroglobulin family)
VSVPSQDNILVRGRVSPAVSGATVKFRATRPNGSVTTHSTKTDAKSEYAFKITPLGTADRGNVRIEAFYDGELKYGADQAECTVPVR